MRLQRGARLRICCNDFQVNIRLSALEEIGDAIWLVEGEIVNFYGFPYPTRSVVVRLPTDDLWVWSPVRLTEEIRNGVSQLGQVRHLVSPNKIHHLYLQEWKNAFPHALLWGPASTIRKRKDLVFRAPLTDASPDEWQGEIEQVWFTGSRAMDEIVFYHRRSRTAVLAVWKITEGYGYAPLEWRLSWLNREPARQALQKLLSWNPEQVVMAHGEWQRENGRAYLERAFDWLGPP